MLPVIDRDEARFAQATKQMIETGDYLAIKFQEEDRNKKPAGIYWLQALSVKMCGQELTTIWPYRLPSLFGAIASILLTFYFANRLFNRQTAWMAALILTASPVLMMEATLATTDALLLASITGCLGLLAVGIQAPKGSPWLSLLLGVTLAFGVMIKGPLILFFLGAAIVGLVFIAKQRQGLKNFNWLLVATIPALSVGPWFFIMQQITHGKFSQDSLGQDFLQKIISVQESHGAPPGFFLVSIFIGLVAIAPWLIPALRQAWQQRFNNQAIAFCLSVIIPAWVVLELIPTKLIHYLLPLYPWVAMLGVWYLQKWRPAVKGTIGAALVVFPVLLAGVFPAIDNLWITEKIYNYAVRDQDILIVGYEEPSAVFRLGTKITFGKTVEDIQKFIERPHGQIFIDSASFPTIDFNTLKFVREISGFNYNKGKAVTLRQYIF